MPTLKEIKGRIGSVRSTLKITSAMKLVSSAKLRKAQNAIAAMRPYEEELRKMLAMASGAGGVTETVTSPAKTANFAGDVPENVTSPAVIIAVASNSSLCGGFNANVIAKVRSVRRPGDVVYSIGRKMADAMARDGFSSPSDYSAPLPGRFPWWSLCCMQPEGTAFLPRRFRLKILAVPSLNHRPGNCWRPSFPGH